MKKLKKNTETFDQIVFRERNREYGAYYLRAVYSKNLNKAIIVAIMIFIATITIPMAANYLSKKNMRFKQDIVVDYGNGIVKPPIDKPLKPKIQEEELKTLLKKNVFKPLIPTSERITDTNTYINDLDTISNNHLDTTSTIEKRIIENHDKGETKKEDSVLIFVQERPEFPGGEAELLKYCAQNIHYPPTAIDYRIQGMVNVSFVVEKDGSITNIRPETKVGAGTEEEAVRVVKLMPKWIPGKQNGKCVRVKVNIPVKFRLD